MSATEALSESNDTPSTIPNDDEKTRISYKNQSHDDDDDLVIESEDEEEGDATLNLTGQSLESIPLSLCKNKGSSSISTLILTKNKLRSLKSLEHFQSISTLQLDRNALRHIDDFPKLPQLKTLWLNNNNLKNLHSLLLILKKQVFSPFECAAKMRFLSDIEIAELFRKNKLSTKSMVEIHPIFHHKI